jgi:hypothetical protein
MRTVATWRCVMSRGLESAWIDLEADRMRARGVPCRRSRSCCRL